MRLRVCTQAAEETQIAATAGLESHSIGAGAQAGRGNSNHAARGH